MDVKQTFLDWTKHTVPHGKEDEYLKDLLPTYLRKDSAGNYYYIIGNSDTMFTAHLDTVGGDESVTHVIDEESGIIKTDGKSVLGADDKAGVVILLYMIEKRVPGFYLFPVGEEVGCIGSGKLAKILHNNKKKTEILVSKKGEQKNIEIDLPSDRIYNNIRKVIAFDRMGYSSIITHQLDQRCCSDEFAGSLATELNKHGFDYGLDDSGVYSDSAEFADLYPECTNVSVGYFAQHSSDETQDIEFLEALADACTKVNWDNLVVARDPRDIEYLDNYYNTWGGRGSGKKNTNWEERNSYIYDDQDDMTPTNYMKDREKDVSIKFFYDEEFEYLSNVSFIGEKMVDINISGDRLEKEFGIIEDLLTKFEVNYDDIFWDGLILVIEEKNNEAKMTRNELLKYLPELDLDLIPGYEDREEELV